MANLILKEGTHSIYEYAEFIKNKRTTFLELAMRRKALSGDVYVNLGVREQNNIDVNNLGVHGEDYSTARLNSSNKVVVTNICQDFRRYRFIPDGHEKKTAFVKAEVKDGILEVETVMDYNFLYGQTDDGFKGLANITGINKVTVPALYKLTDIRDAIVTIGGDQDVILTNSKGALSLSDLYKKDSTKLHSDVVVDFTLRKMIVLTKDLTIIIDDNIKDGDFFVLKSDELQYNYTKDLSIEELARIGSNTKVMIDAIACATVDVPQNILYISTATV